MAMSVEPWIGGVAAQGEDAAARPADVAEQQLQDRRRADHLHAGRVLRPADGVADRRRAVRARAFASSVSATFRNVSRGVPQTCSTISGV